MIRLLFFVLVAAPVLLQCSSCGSNAAEGNNPPFFDVLAPDGSKHYMLGTMHLGVGFTDLSEGVIYAMSTADIFIAEMTTEGVEKLRNDKKKNNKPRGHSLRQQLDEQYWSALRQQLPHVSEQELDRMTVEDVTGVMLVLAANNIDIDKEDNILGREDTLDFSINDIGEYTNKRIIGLDEHIAPSLLSEALMTNINELKDIISCGGIPCLQAALAEMRTIWLQGDLDALQKKASEIGGAMENFQRDQAWVDSGIVQNNCRHGQVCFIYVGAAHLFDDHNSFATILRQHGYQIEKHRPEPWE